MLTGNIIHRKYLQVFLAWYCCDIPSVDMKIYSNE